MALSPFDEAWKVWMRAYPDADPRLWLDAVAWHMRTGYVFSTPEYFIMARAVPHAAPLEQVADNTREFTLDQVSAWLVWAASGRGCMAQFLDLMPYHLPYVAFARDGGELKIYPTDQLKRIIHYGRRQTATTEADCTAGDQSPTGSDRRRQKPA